ncbi:SDR family NAD(P)-dependent oxidoreductase [Herbiconiux ginsengi]|uniref:Short-chain dehydrogenase n=1 Tax=Herbiconiux ginsengi TaxID=381665 RepID=A0A1H3T898_9MICO|nr:SDR family NAD(P)-dependent oxidoreductase [Herbiconiux ginsengi]SDZ45569.1 Short-chain dehydrogenase [Herbiconiux ginsengi]
MTGRTVVVIGGTSGIGLKLARGLIDRGDRVVLTGREEVRARDIATELGPKATGIALDLADPHSIARSLESVGTVHGLVLSAIERDSNTVRAFDIDRAGRTATIKLVGYLEVVHSLVDRLEASVATGIVLFGGIARYRPYPGSLTVSTVNGGIEGMAIALAGELAPIRVNVLHPGIIGDSPFWADKAAALEGYRSRTPGGELATVNDVVGSALFLLDNTGVSDATVHVNRATLSA